MRRSDRPLANAAGVTAPYPGFTGAVGNALRPYPQYRASIPIAAWKTTECPRSMLCEVMLAAALPATAQPSDLLYLVEEYHRCRQPAARSERAAAGYIRIRTTCIRRNRISSQDIPHKFVLSYIYELPFGKGKHFLNGGGWIGCDCGRMADRRHPALSERSTTALLLRRRRHGWDNCFRFNAGAGSIGLQSGDSPARLQSADHALSE